MRYIIDRNLGQSLGMAIALVMMSLGTIAMMSWRTGVF